MMRLGRRVFKDFKLAIKNEIFEREKLAYKQRMWSKVNNWLQDLDIKPVQQQ